MGSNVRLLPLVTFVMILGVISSGVAFGTVLKFTNIKCVAFDKAFADFRYCRLVVPERGKVAIDLRVELYKVPVANVTTNMRLWKKISGFGFQPFLSNYSNNFCKLMEKPPRISFQKIIFDMLMKDSNINHSCPYYDDIIVKNMVLRYEYFRLLPLPSGEYMFNMKVAAYNDWKADVKIYISITLD